MGINQRRSEQKADTIAFNTRLHLEAEATSLIAEWNEAKRTDLPELFTPTIAAALISKHHWLIIVCESCGTLTDLDIRVKPRPPSTPISSIVQTVNCPRCNGHGRPRALKLVRSPYEQK